MTSKPTYPVVIWLSPFGIPTIPLRAPQQHLPPSSFRQIAAVEVEGTLRRRLAKRKAVPGEFAFKKCHESRLIPAGEAKARQERRAMADEGDRSAEHRRPVPDSGLAADENRSSSHVEADEIACASRDGDQPAPHRVADLV